MWNLFKTNKNILTIFHEFKKPPYGGGNQFLLALKKEFEKMNYSVTNNRVTSNTKAGLFNSYNFDFKMLYKYRDKFRDLKMIHRVDGPISVYRGIKGDCTDKKIWRINHDLADKTIFQSEYSLNMHIEMGLKFKNPIIISNAVDYRIFNAVERIPHPSDMRKIRLIASSWSDNPKKGSPFYKELEGKLDWSKYDFTFLGRSNMKFQKIRTIDPLPSHGVADVLRQHDIYITASQDDPCSNSVLEALACGLPVVYLKSGGHPEIVNDGGLSFNNIEEALKAIESISKDYTEFQNKIVVNRIEEVAKKYLEVMEIF